MIELLPTFYKADNSGSLTPDTNTADSSLAYFNQLKQLLERAEAAADSKRQQKTSESNNNSSSLEIGRSNSNNNTTQSNKIFAMPNGQRVRTAGGGFGARGAGALLDEWVYLM